MNINSHLTNKLPYITITVKNRKLNLLIDTGSDESYINPSLIKPEKTIQIPPVKVTTISNQILVNKIINLHGFPEFKTKQKLLFHLLKFHKKFDGLIGVNIIKQLGIIIDLKMNY